MSRQTAMIIGAVVALVLLAVAGGVLFVNSQQRVVVGSAAAPTFAPPPTLQIAPTAAPATASSTEPVLGRTEGTSDSPETSTSRLEPSSVPSVAPSPLGTSTTPATPTLLPTEGSALPITPARLSASGNAPNSQDAEGNITTFVAENAGDGRIETAWRIAGDGVNQWLLIEFARPVELRELRILPGYAKIDEQDGTNRFLQNRRVRRVRLEFSTGASVEALLDDLPVLQPILTDNVRTEFVRIVILESLPPALADGREFTPISEVEAVGVMP
jgi:hypothetical protein